MAETVMNEFARPSTAEVIDRVAAALGDRNITTVIAKDGADAKDQVLGMLPTGAEVHSGKSKTLEDAGIFRELNESGKFEFLRTKMMAMDRQTQSREMRKMIGAPDFMLGSVAAVTTDGILVAASASASQLGPYAVGAGKLILVVGSQKIVPDLETALRRVRDYVLPWEDARVFEAIGIHSFLAKTLIIEREWQPDRTTVVLVREPIGV